MAHGGAYAVNCSQACIAVLPATAGEDSESRPMIWDCQSTFTWTVTLSLSASEARMLPLSLALGFWGEHHLYGPLVGAAYDAEFEGAALRPLECVE